MSKQGFHQMLERRMHYYDIEANLLRFIRDIRKDHPTMACRTMYFMIQPEHIGRDAFERLCMENGFSSPRSFASPRTTDSSGVIRFENHLITLILEYKDQAWCSDITYFKLNDRFYFITFIIDCYSRRILGHSTTKNLTTEQTSLPAFQMALKTRGGKIPKGMIFHSDGGGQYYDKEFLALTSKHEIINSMCEYAYENGKAERVNGVIKNNYLKHYHIETYEQLVKSVDRAVYLYNHEKPHSKLKRLTPVGFENRFEKRQEEVCA